MSEEDGFPGVHAGQRHDVQVGQPRFIGVGDGQQVLQVPDLGVDLVPSSLGRSFGRAVHVCCVSARLELVKFLQGFSSWMSGVSARAVSQVCAEIVSGSQVCCWTLILAGSVVVFFFLQKKVWIKSSPAQPWSLEESGWPPAG